MIDIAIIGAGAAGIAAARQLADSGLEVRVLEARGRVGGRGCTDTATLGAAADLGAAWLHFADENPWTALARAQGCTVIERDPGWGASSRVRGATPTPAQSAAAEAALGRNWELIGAAAQAGRDVPVSTLLPEDAFRPRFDAIMTWIMGVESREVSSVDLDRYAESRCDWAVAEGLGSVLEGAARGLPVRLNTPVTQVHWGGSRLRLSTPEGEVEARGAIVTVPTSVIHGGGLRFAPPLPQSHASALADLPLGSCNKVFFRFDEAQLPPESFHCLADATRSRTIHFGMRPAGQPLVMAYFGGDLSRDLEREDALAAYAREALGDIYGAQFAGGICGTLATAWNGDPWARGCYSSARPGAADQRRTLSQPVTPRLLFAGEACDENHYGTIYGAWRSGVAAADSLLHTLRTTP